MSDELSQLKDRADQLGIKYHPNIGLESLKVKVNAAITGETPPAETAPAETGPVTPPPAEITSPTSVEPSVVVDTHHFTGAITPPAPIEPPAPKAETLQEMRNRLIQEATALVRCRITCLNPAKAHLKGEILTVGNKFTGAISKYVAFGEATDNGYHVPKIIFDELKQRKFNSLRSEKAANGTHRPVQRLVNEFAIEVMDPLTPEELDQLARQQAAAAGM